MSLILLLNQWVFATIKLPTGLNSEDRQLMLYSLGLGTSSKRLTNPHPLGGYSGFEIGISLESIKIDELGDLGNKSDIQSNFSFARLTMGKGMYHNIDFFLHFVPLTESIGFSEFGFDVRWIFYQAKFFPTNFSLVFQGNSSNIINQIISTTQGVDLITGINIIPFSIYLGIGQLFSKGFFTGNSQLNKSLTSSGVTEVESISSFHSIIGTTFHYDPFFIAFEINRYLQPVYAAKLGMRY